ncbi:MAG: hypothetical protein LBC17_01735 [Lactobacillaceae bacterium]|jgi:hypothetical protein|nr:hypothetical protein [Lactobacillaceae bacterium]
MAGLQDAIIGQLVQNVLGQVLNGNKTTTTQPAVQETNSGFDLSKIITALSGDKLAETAGKILTDQGVDQAKVQEAEKTNDPNLISTILGSLDQDQLATIATKILGAVTK